MHLPSRARRIVKRTGVVLSLLILAAWMVNVFWEYSARPSQRVYWSISGGRFLLVASPLDLSYRVPPPYGLRGIARFNDLRAIGFVSPKLQRLGYKIQVGSPPIYYWVFEFPFWLPLLLTAIPTAWLWYRDRRRIPPGHCPRCGYDLTGNTSGVCSECGEKTTTAKRELIGEGGK